MHSWRKDLSLKDRLDIIHKCNEPGVSQRSVALSYGVNKSTVCKIMKRKDGIIQQLNDGFVRSGQKRSRHGFVPEVDEALFIWFKEKRAQGATVSGPIMRSKALQLAQLVDRENFSASEGWFARWKKRYNIAFKVEHGEKRSSDFSAANHWTAEKVPEILAEYVPSNIFNADETGLYFKGLPDRGHVLASEKAEGCKVPKDRVTILVCANMDGSEKRRLLMIGKSKRPRYFPKDITKLPLDYDNSANAWMTSEIFCKWLNKWNVQLQATDRKICLLVDNCTAHPQTVYLSHIRLIFLPPNTTAIVQPMDMGVIKNLKGHYRSKLSSRIIGMLDADKTKDAGTVLKSVNLLDCIYLVTEAWNDVKGTTIANCFSHAKFSTDGLAAAELPDPLFDVPVPVSMTVEAFRQHLDIDESAETFGELTDIELIDAATVRLQRIDDSDDYEVVEKTPNETLIALDCVRQYAMKAGMDEFVINTLRELERRLHQDILLPKPKP